MVRRWSIAALSAVLVSGSVLATAGAASAAVRHTASHPGAAAVHSAYRPGGLIRWASGPHLTHRGGHTTGQSTNWSGYAVTGGNGAFTSVSASWTQPSASCSGVKRAQYSSFWVGLDGYNSNSVEQTGTDADCSGSTPVYYGWYEMYPAYPVNYSNAVHPGDAMSASVTFSGSDTYTLVLKDSTQNWTQTQVINQTGLSRSSAEVITEAPSSSRGVLPLANFGTVNYSVSSANGSSLGTQNPIQILMVDSGGNQKDTTSPIDSQGGFGDTWLRST